jgi:hypothetical protein
MNNDENIEEKKMKRLVYSILLMLMIFVLAGCGSEPSTVSEVPRVLVIIRSYSTNSMSLMTDTELGVMVDMLEDAGVEIAIASHTYDPFESDARTITPDMLISEVDASDYDAVLIPCLSTGLGAASEEIIELVEEFGKQDKVIAAQHGARATLFEAEVIADDQMGWSGIVQVGKVITSDCCPDAARYYGCEDGTSDLIELLLAALNQEG